MLSTKLFYCTKHNKQSMQEFKQLLFYKIKIRKLVQLCKTAKYIYLNLVCIDQKAKKGVFLFTGIKLPYKVKYFHKSKNDNT